MKLKLSILLFFALLSAASMQAQGFSVRVGGGFAVPVSKDVLEISQFADTSGNIYNDNVYGTLGGGLRLNVAPGWWINEHFGVELGVTWLMSSRITAFQQIAPGTEVNVDAYTRQLQLAPALMLRSGTEGVQVYSRVGAVLPIIGTTYQEVSVATVFGGQTFTNYQKIANKGSLSIGFQGAIGVFYPINDMISVFAEIEAVSLKIKSKTAEVTEYTTNGQDLLDNLNTIDRYTNFQDEISNSSNNPDFNSNPDTNSPLEDLSTKSPYSGAGINIGIILNLF
ncbi:MAG: outer membrane beta-barrel protein [Bacteroidia bacterium]|nr:outer membrane beta-barrel protein [Bacteroidia bacterium]